MKKFWIGLPLLAVFACAIKERPVVIDYPGGKLPGLTAEEFAPGIVSTDSFEHSSPVFSPDGTVVLWNIVSRIRPPYLLEMTYENGAWSAPHRPAFGDSTADDFYPSFSSNGKILYFSSRRKAPAGYPQGDIRIWAVERNVNTWGVPVPFDTTISNGHEYAHSITNDSTLYFSSTQGGEMSWNIRKSQMRNGKYTGTVSLPFGINSINYEDGAFVSPDESFLIFESHRAEGIDGSMDLYISFKLDDDRWSLPLNMGPSVNSDQSERMAKMSPDGKYLFFGSTKNVTAPAWGFDIFWVDAKVIDELKKDPLAKVAIDPTLGDELVIALASGDQQAGRSEGLLKRWTSQYPNDMEGARTYIVTLRKQKKYLEADQFAASLPEDWLDKVMFKTDVALTKLGLGKNDEATAMLESLLVSSPDVQMRYYQIINGLQDMALYDLSDQYFERQALKGLHPVQFYNKACFYSKAGEKDRAFKFLDRAADNGYNSISQYENDTDLTQLKTDPRWNKLRKKLK